MKSRLSALFSGLLWAFTGTLLIGSGLVERVAEAQTVTPLFVVQSGVQAGGPAMQVDLTARVPAGTGPAPFKFSLDGTPPTWISVVDGALRVAPPTGVPLTAVPIQVGIRVTDGAGITKPARADVMVLPFLVVQASAPAGGAAAEIDLAARVPSTSGLVAPFSFTFAATKPEWVSLNGSVLRVAPASTTVATTSPILVEIRVADSSAIPVVRSIRADLSVLPALPPVFIGQVSAQAGGAVKELDLATLVPTGSGLVLPVSFVFSGTKPEWVTLNGTVLRVAPPATVLATNVPIAVGLSVKDSAATPVVRTARVDVGVLAAAVPEGPVFIGQVSAQAGGAVKELDLATLVPTGSGLVLPVSVSVTGAKPEWVTLAGTVLRVAPPATVLATSAPIAVGLSVKDSAATPVVRTARVDVGVLAAAVPEGPVFIGQVSAQAGGAVKELDLATLVPTGSGLVLPVSVAVTGTKPEWVTLNGTVLRVAPPATVLATTVPIAVGLSVKDASATPVVRTARVDVGVLAAAVPDGPVFIGQVSAQAGGAVKELDLATLVPTGSGLVLPVSVTVTGTKPEWVTLNGTVLRVAPPATVLATSVPIAVGLSVKDSAATPVVRTARVDVGVLAAPVPEGPVFSAPVAVQAGTVKELDLAKLVPAESGLVAPVSFVFAGAKPEWVTLVGTVLRVAPPATVLATSAPIAVGLSVKDSAATLVVRTARVDVGVLAAPVPEGPVFSAPVAVQAGTVKELDLAKLVPAESGLVAPVSFVFAGAKPEWVTLVGTVLRVAPPATVLATSAPIAVGLSVKDSAATPVVRTGRVDVGVLAAPVPEGPVFSAPVAVQAGTVKELDLAKLVPAESGLVAPVSFVFAGAKPEWVTLVGTVLRVAPPATLVATSAPIAVGLSVKDSAATPVVRTGRVDVGVLAAPVPEGPVFSAPVAVQAGTVKELDLAKLVPAESGLVAPVSFVFAGAKPEWVTLVGTVLRVAPPATVLATSAPIAVGLSVKDSAATPVVRTGRVDVGVLAAPVPEGPVFSAPVAVQAGTVKELDLAKLVPAESGLVLPVSVAITGTKPEWVTLNGTVLRVAPPATVLATSAPIAVGLSVKDSAATPVVRTGRVDVGVLAAPVPEGPLFSAPVVVQAGTVKELDLAKLVPTGSGLVLPVSVAITGTKPDWVTLNGTVLRVAPPATLVATTVPIAVGLSVKDSAATPVERTGRVDVGVLAAPAVPEGPLFSVPVVVQAGTVKELDLAKLVPADSGLVLPVSAAITGTKPEWVTLVGTVLRVAPPATVLATSAPIAVGLSVKDSSATPVVRTGRVDVGVLAAPVVPTLVMGLEGEVKVVATVAGAVTKLSIEAIGTVSSGGWTQAMLRPVTTGATAVSRAFEFVALPPTGVATQALSTVRAAVVTEVPVGVKQVELLTRAGAKVVWTAPVVPDGPAFVSGLSVPAGSVKEVDLAKLLPSDSGLVAPVSFGFVGTKPEWVTLSGTVLRVAPVGTVAATSAPIPVGLTVKDASMTRSARVDLSVLAPAIAAPFITRQPIGGTLPSGGVVNLSVTASGGDGLKYQWRRNGVAIVGADDPTFTANEPGAYSVTVSNVSGSVASAVANVAVAVAPTITQSPASGNLGDDETLTLQVLASGTAPLAYQWTRDGIVVAGATGSKLTVDGGGTYVVTVSNSVGKTLSAPAIIKTPVDVKGFAGEYRGLFKVSVDPAFAGLDHSGLVTVTVDQDGSVSGRILRRLGAQNFTAQSDEFGNIVFGATQQTPSLSLMSESGSLGRLSLELVRTKEGRRLRGRVTSTVGTKSVDSAVLACVPVRSATTAESGRYTAIFQQVDGQGGSYPDGDGYALFTVSPTAVSVTGKLADGSAITASGKMLEDGTVPIFVGLYGGKGFLAGTIKMGLTQTRTDATGLEMRWFKGAGVTGGIYPNGWSSGVRLEFAASKYDPAKGFGLGNTTNLSLRFLASGGGLSAEQKDAATISAASVLTISKSSPLKLTSVFTSTSGVVSGTFTPVGSALSLKYEGVVLQKADFASGYFIREGRSGFIQIQK